VFVGHFQRDADLRVAVGLFSPFSFFFSDFAGTAPTSLSPSSAAAASAAALCFFMYSSAPTPAPPSTIAATAIMMTSFFLPPGFFPAGTSATAAAADMNRTPERICVTHAPAHIVEDDY
jgi:hypothetical protein